LGCNRIDLKSNPARDDRDKSWSNLKQAKLGLQGERALLRNNQPLAISRLKKAILHRCIAGKDIQTCPLSACGRTIQGHALE